MRKYAPLLEEEHSDRIVFVTLSLKNSRSLEQDRDKAFKSFSKLRRQKPFVEAWDGGLVGFETKRTEDGRWNSHLHVVICGEQVDEKTLSERWETLTGARVLDFGVAFNPLRALSYTLKSFREDAECADAVEEYNRDLKGKILAQSFGTWYGVKEPANEPFGCHRCGT